MYEVELKAHVTDRESVRAKTAAFARYDGTADKADTYWKQSLSAGAGTAPRVRVRAETAADASGAVTTATYVTYKHKETREDIEVNEETEFSVSDRAAFEFFIQAAGFTRDTVKHKKTERWRHGRALIELAEVAGLGDFIEIEILSDTEDAQTIAALRSELLHILALSGVSESAIEPRYYSELLRLAGR